MDNKRMGVKKTTISANHASREFLHKLNELRWNRTLVDVVITGDSEEGATDKGIMIIHHSKLSHFQNSFPEIFAHKLLLCGCSPYFNTLFGSNHWDVKSKNDNQDDLDRIHVGGVSMSSLRSLIDFMYHGEITINEENAADILVAADLLLMDRLKEAICKFIQTIICAANCVFISKLSDVYSCR